MKTFSSELKTIMGHSDWTDDEKIEYIEEIHDKYVNKKINMLTISDFVDDVDNYNY